MENSKENSKELMDSKIIEGLTKLGYNVNKDTLEIFMDQNCFSHKLSPNKFAICCNDLPFIEFGHDDKNNIFYKFIK